METFSAWLAICARNSPVTSEFPSQRPVTRGFDVFFDLCLNKQLSTQSWGLWFKTPSSSLLRNCNDFEYYQAMWLYKWLLCHPQWWCSLDTTRSEQIIMYCSGINGYFKILTHFNNSVFGKIKTLITFSDTLRLRTVSKITSLNEHCCTLVRISWRMFQNFPINNNDIIGCNTDFLPNQVTGH